MNYLASIPIIFVNVKKNLQKYQIFLNNVAIAVEIIS